jgi:hypothetical protein
MIRSALVPAALATLCAGVAVAQGRGCPEPDSTAPWARVSRAFRDTPNSRWTNDSLRRVLLGMAERDQRERQDFGTRSTDSAYMKRLVASDSVLAANVERILDRFGLPTRSMVGAEGARALMLIVQHNGRLQERVIALAKAAGHGEVPIGSLAMMEDRLLNSQGKPQVYGTNFPMKPDGQFALGPTIDWPNLDARRAAAGIPPMALYVCMMEEAGMRIDRSSLPPARP